MKLAEALNKEKIKPVVVNGGKVGLYQSGPDQKPPTEAGSHDIEAQFGVSDTYISQSPLSHEMNNLVVWVYTETETVFFNKTTQKWASVDP